MKNARPAAGTNRFERQGLAVILVPVMVVAVWFWLNRDLGLGLADEGRFWYNAWRTSLGEVPLRDFRSYDPGRYYWTAIFIRVFGNGLSTIRLASSCLVLVGLVLAFRQLGRTRVPLYALVSTALLSFLWMFPSHKLFDIGISLSAVFFGAILFERPSIRRHFAAGVFIGVAAFFNRNHGVYGLLGLSLIALVAYLRVEREGLARKALAVAAGIAAGYAPMILMLVFIPGFFEGFWAQIERMLRTGDTNIPLPIPWPWHTQADLSTFLRGMLYLAMPLCYAFLIRMVLKAPREVLRQRALVLSSSVVGMVYLHHAFARADIAHLSQSIHPLFIGLAALTGAVSRRGDRIAAACATCFVLAVSLYTIVPVLTIYQKITMPGQFVPIGLGKDRVLVVRETAHIIEVARSIDTEKVRPGEALLIAPHWPGLYAVLQRKSPLWQTYFLVPEARAVEVRMLKEFEQNNVTWIILGDIPLDGRDDLRLRNTNPFLWQHIEKYFEQAPFEGLPERYRLLRKKQQGAFSAAIGTQTVKEKSL